MSTTIIRVEETYFSFISEGDREFRSLILTSAGLGRADVMLSKAACRPVIDNDPSISSQCYPVPTIIAGAWPVRVGHPPAAGS